MNACHFSDSLRSRFNTEHMQPCHAEKRVIEQRERERDRERERGGMGERGK